MNTNPSRWLPVCISIGLHAGLLLAFAGPPLLSEQTETDPFETLQVIMIPPPPPEQASPDRPTEASGPSPEPVTTPPDQAPAFLEAPPAPTAEEWRLASTYTLKNSKRYRHTWAQQVRSMMGTAVEGPDQGVVRFAIEIAPNGQVVRVDTIWSTSDKAEQLARAAIAALPPLPPTPTGEPLVFEKTISFQPFETGWPPIYKYDCLPDPPKYGNPFVWDGKTPTMPQAPSAAAGPPVQRPSSAECPDAPEDSLEAEAADMQRQFDMWESSRLKAPD